MWRWVGLSSSALWLSQSGFTCHFVTMASYSASLSVGFLIPKTSKDLMVLPQRGNENTCGHSAL